MAIVRFRRFTKPNLLRAVGRTLLDTFLSRFRDDLAGVSLEPPDTGLPDADYYHALVKLLLAPEALPGALNEALFAIDEMATPEGQERLEKAVTEAGLDLSWAVGSSREEIALQVWLAAPELLTAAHNQQRMQRLARFEYFGAGATPGKRAAFIPPGAGALNRLCLTLDAWFARHHRGREMVAVEMYPIDGEYWFLVQHGDTYVRAPAIEERQRKGVLHFRPERDDVVVYSPEQDEIRINARTRGERDLYREAFGLMLRGSEDYFSEQRTYTLEPLRLDGAGALAVEGIDAICKITLREIEVVSDNAANEFIVEGANDLFDPSAAVGSIPRSGRLTRAQFDFHFTDSPRPRPVQIQLPNVLKLGRHCDVRAVHRWACQCGFRVGHEACGTAEI
jgi:hypothetical protein